MYLILTGASHTLILNFVLSIHSSGMWISVTFSSQAAARTAHTLTGWLFINDVTLELCMDGTDVITQYPAIPERYPRWILSDNPHSDTTH